MFRKSVQESRARDRAVVGGITEIKEVDVQVGEMWTHLMSAERKRRKQESVGQSFPMVAEMAMGHLLLENASPFVSNWRCGRW